MGEIGRPLLAGLVTVCLIAAFYFFGHLPLLIFGVLAGAAVLGSVLMRLGGR